MTPSSTTRTPRARRRRMLLLLAAGSAILSFSAGQLSLALFTDQASVDGTFSSGTISIDDGEIAQLSLGVSGMLPGDSVTDAVVVKNDGSGTLRYAMVTSSTNPGDKNLRDVLTLTVKAEDAGGGCAAFTGATVLSATALGDGGTSARFGALSSGPSGTERVLAPEASETLCFRVTLPLATNSDYQAASTVTTFTFSAEQTANNPLP